MKRHIEKQFEHIAEATITGCEKVECSRQEFLEGMKIVEEALTDRSDMER